MPCLVQNLNQTKRSDYYFGGADNRVRQYSRKQAGEILSDIDEAESQLRDYYDNADENNQIVEGIISTVKLTKKRPTASDFPTVRYAPPNALYSYSVTPQGWIYNERLHNLSYPLFCAWLYQLSESGIITYFTLNSTETARLLVAQYNSVQKLEHHTLNRYIRPRLAIAPQDPFIKALMALSLCYDIGIGETKATAIRDAGYHCLMELALCQPEELRGIPGIGNTIANKIINSLREGINEGDTSR